MGYLVELNTLLGLPKDFDVATLEIGNNYEIVKARERAFPLHVAILIVDSDWNFYGYGVAHEITVKGKETIIKFEVLSLFPKELMKTYKAKFTEAAKLTGEL